MTNIFFGFEILTWMENDSWMKNIFFIIHIYFRVPLDLMNILKALPLLQKIISGILQRYIFYCAFQY